MKHPSSNALFRHWNERRGGRLAPERTDIDPSPLRTVLADIFMLAWDTHDALAFRLAGTRVCALFGRELKGEIFAALWNDRPQVEAVLRIVFRENLGVVLGVAGQDLAETRMELELLLLPLAGGTRSDARAIGSLAALRPSQTGAGSITHLSTGSCRWLDEETSGRTGPRVGTGLRSLFRQGLVVYEGGRS